MTKDIPGYEGRYTISIDGHIFNRWGNKLNPHVNPHGYMQVQLTDDAGKRKNWLHHRLVALTYIPNAEDKPHINHINGIKTDNSVNNLEWCTRSENVKHAVDSGLYSRGKGNHAGHKLIESDVRMIRDLIKVGMSNMMIAELFTVSRQLISNIKTGRKWSHVA